MTNEYVGPTAKSADIKALSPKYSTIFLNLPAINHASLFAGNAPPATRFAPQNRILFPFTEK